MTTPKIMSKNRLEFTSIQHTKVDVGLVTVTNRKDSVLLRIFSDVEENKAVTLSTEEAESLLHQLLEATARSKVDPLRDGYWECVDDYRRALLDKLSRTILA